MVNVFFLGNLIFISYQHENLYSSKIDITTQLLVRYNFDDYGLKTILMTMI